MKKLRIIAVLAAIAGLVCLSGCTGSFNAAEEVAEASDASRAVNVSWNSTGWNGGMYYSFWTDGGGNVQKTLNDGGK